MPSVSARLVCLAVALLGRTHAFSGVPKATRDPNASAHRHHHPSRPPPRRQRRDDPPPPSPLAFDGIFGSNMVLQQQPATACVHGLVGEAQAAVSLTLLRGNTTVAKAAARLAAGGQWKAWLPAQPAGEGYTLVATSGGGSARLENVSFGDVWYCAGQSNMALPLANTLSRNISRDAIRRGKYSQIRIHGMSGNMNPQQPWATLASALASSPDPEHSQLFQFSSTCYYFAESLVDELSLHGLTPPPLGLVHTAWGGSTIEQWLDTASLAACANVSHSSTDGKWHTARVVPYASMALKGWVWYQGENDMHSYFGNSLLGTGYSCLMPRLVASWRELWGAPDAPFGVVSLAPSGSEGGDDIGTMRWAQTAGYGVLPNAAMPHTFLAHAYDLNDPFSNTTCAKLTGCPSAPRPPAGWGACEAYCASVRATPFYEGPIHPRDKKAVGARLARGAAAEAYGAAAPYVGPTLAGCTAAAAAGKLSLAFGGGGEAVAVRPYDRRAGASKLQVLVNASRFCMQAEGRGDAACVDDGTGAAVPGGGFGAAWVAVDMAASGRHTVEVDLAKSGGVAYAIRYAWEGDCCSEDPPHDGPCPLASCPIIGGTSGLPANPFIAKLTADGKCKCIPPQQCDE
ncbi:hypothetical protein AB1Y20_014479 [Prymnesium parvum]|uniref:Sialate O-acetylesterase domain-containing protein n=1 Tax=Prymnesium parvum TaxID=97485 RepID=A0AB34IHC1_PRYPA